MRYFLYCRKSQEAEDRQILSMPSQRIEAEKRFGSDEAIEIVAVFEEAMSAKAPGRPIFNDMISRIEAGEAQGIVAWAPDRLARNSIDGGRVVYLLDIGKLRDLKFLTYTFENNSQGKFMLNIMFGQSKYYSDALSENVKRGNRAKAAKGWRPSTVPLGYRHDPSTRTIVADPHYFPIVRRMFDLMLSGGYSARAITRMARDDWGVRSPTRWRRGGGPLSNATVHRILTNPFYAGYFELQGQAYQGRHTLMVTFDEFNATQAAVSRGRERPKRQSFPFTGLIRCASCGRAVTAERKVNTQGRRYTYYHCSKSGDGPRCKEPSLRAEHLEAQIVGCLEALAIGSDVEHRLKQFLERVSSGTAAAALCTRETVEKTLRDVQAQLSELLGLRLRGVIGDEEFVPQRTKLQTEAVRLARRLDELARPAEPLIPRLHDAIWFNKYAADCFRRGDDDLKRQIFALACSNATLSAKKLNIEAAKWLSALSKIASCLSRRGYRDDVRISRTTTGLDALVKDQSITTELGAISRFASQHPQRPQVPDKDHELRKAA